MSLNAFFSLLNPTCFKRHFSKAEYEAIKKNATLVNSTTLYTWYKDMGGQLAYNEFYPVLKRHLYYDKYVCAHGVEFYYYTHLYITHKEELPTDVLHIIKAIGGYYV